MTKKQLNDYKRLIVYIYLKYTQDQQEIGHIIISKDDSKYSFANIKRANNYIYNHHVNISDYITFLDDPEILKQDILIKKK